MTQTKPKILMYGWEFPPLISGGLGMACHAIVKELAKKGVNLTLVLPQTVDDCVLKEINFVGCDDLVSTKQNFDGIVDIKRSEITTHLSPYGGVSKCCNQSFSKEESKDFFELLASMHLPDELKEMAKAAAKKQCVDMLVEVFRYAQVSGALADDIQHDVIYAHDWLTMLAALEAKRHSNKPVVLHIHALETDRSGMLVDKRIFAIEKYGMEQADKIIAVSQYTKNNIVRHYGINPEKITVVHNGVYCRKSPPRDSHDKKRPKMVLFLGRITGQKGPSFFIEVAKKVLESRSDVQFVLAGAGDMLVDMIKQVASLRIGKNVHFTGFLDQDMVQEIYKLADVYVMPSVSEPFGLSALEALSYNVPSIISKQSGVSEVSEQFLISDFWDIEDMAAKILVLLDYPALRKTTLNDVNKELQEISWDKAADKIINVYEDMMFDGSRSL